jgi:hypothetical protein
MLFYQKSAILGAFKRKKTSENSEVYQIYWLGRLEAFLSTP